MLVVLPLRTFFLLIGQAVFYLYFRINGYKHSWDIAGKWWSVWGNLADLGCLSILFILMKREGLTLNDLFKPLTKSIIWKGLLVLLIVAPFSALGSIIGSWLIYGNWHANLSPGILYGRRLPIWAVIYSFLIWAPLWSATEEMTYNGYLATRINELTKKKGLTLFFVCFWWAIQHSFLPFIPDWHYCAWRFISFIPCVIALVAVFLKTRNLSSMIFAHLIMDMGAVAATLAF